MGVSDRTRGSAEGRGLLHVRLFGRLTALRDGTELDLGPPKQRALLAILLLHRGRMISSDRLIDLLWGDHPPRTAGHSLQVYVSDLRRVLGPSVIRTERPGYVVDDAALEVDTDRFERAAALARGAVRDGKPDAADLLEAALGLWQGDPLSDFEYAEFATAVTTRLRALRLDTLDDLGHAHLAAGEPARALTVAESLVREDQFRESGRELLMLALYRCGRFPEALRSFSRYRALLADELGLDPSPRLHRLYERILIHEPSLDPVLPDVAVIAGPVRNPYKGLRAFAEEDAADFFGREALVEQVLEKLRGGSRLVAVVGPSGCGKSSLVAAGVLPRVRAGALPGSQPWTIVKAAPGADPITSLHRAVAAAVGEPTATVSPVQEDARLLLVLDQFEENFIAADEGAQREILDALCNLLADGSHIVILTLRADMYDRPLRHPAFAELFTAGVVNVLPMRAAELEAAIVAPARRVGVPVESSLVAEMVAATVARPALLPLLQYSLTELFESAGGDELGLAQYRRIGGLSGALTRRAEQIRRDWRDDELEVATQLFLRLVRVGPDGRTSRRTLPVAELAGLRQLDSVAIADVVEGLGRHRLVSIDRELPSGRATVDVAHECLFDEWPWLRELIDQHAAALRRHASLRVAIAEWEAADRDPDYLLGGGRLGALLVASRNGVLQLTDAEATFLDACETKAASAVADQRVRRRRQRVGTWITAATAATAATIVALFVVPGDRAPQRVAYLRYGGGYIEDLATRGVDRAAHEAHLSLAVEHLGDHDPNTVLSRMAGDQADLVVTTIVTADVTAVAAAHPEIPFVYLNGLAHGVNVTATSFADQEGAFLAGAAAAMASKSKIVGFLGGADTALLRRYEAGFTAGAEAGGPSVRVLVRYASRVPDYRGFDDPVLAGRVAQQMLDRGVDVLFAAAGAAQFGAVQAVVEQSAELHRQLWAIGADVDLYTWPEWQRGPDDKQHILTSMIKRFDVVSYEAVRDFAAGTLKSGTRVYDLASNQMALAKSGGYLAPYQPRLDALRRAIIDGHIVVPCVPNGLTGQAAIEAAAGPKCPR